MATESSHVISEFAARTFAETANSIVKKLSANELFFSVVGHIGSGTSEIADVIKDSLEKSNYEVHVFKASAAIRVWTHANTATGIPSSGMASAIAMQDAGDYMRKNSKDFAAISRALISEVRKARAKAQNAPVVKNEPVVPDGTKRAYIFDSLRHPDEVKLLRTIYKDAFILVGVVCDAEERKKRLLDKFSDASSDDVKDFMQRDADDDKPYGQLVADTFYLSDFFVDNTQPRFKRVGLADSSNPQWMAAEDIERLIDIVTHSAVVTPSTSETAMYHANGARMQSACLSRQVGAALVGRDNEVISTGCNEVPKAGGGLYNGGEKTDYRCAFHNKYCSSTKEQNSIIDQIIAAFPELQGGDQIKIQKRLRKSPIGRLLEFSRAVHAEMDALLSASRKGVSTLGSRLFVTTFPCHYCARHIVAAGVDEVQYIEPYPKSLAIRLHDDAVTTTEGGISPSAAALRIKVGLDLLPGQEDAKVLFRAFTGVAPRLYKRGFLSERSLKDKITGQMKLGIYEWGPSIEVKRASYIDIEAAVADE